MSLRTLLALILVLFLLLPASLASGSNNATDRQKARQLAEKGIGLNDNSKQEAGYYQKAIILDPGYAQAYFNLGFVYQSQDRLDKAVQAYKKCLKLTPKRYEAHLNLADCLLALRRDASLYQVRQHKNLAIELQEALPRGKRGIPIQEQRAQLLELEKRIQQVFKPQVKPVYTQAEIIAILSRRITRGGQALYAGPRLALLIFKTGSASLSAESVKQLKALALAFKSPELKEYDFELELEGHADGRGRAKYNRLLSRQRAEAVLHFLIDKTDIDMDRIQAVWFGEDRPIFPNDSAKHYKYNRRIEIVRSYGP